MAPTRSADPTVARASPLRLERVADLESRAGLDRVAGRFRRVAREPMLVPGFSGARFERVRLIRSDGTQRALVLKRVRLSVDWTARLTGDTVGREAMIATDDRFADVWRVYRCPYLACAVEGEEAALLMEDLSGGLLPDVREPLAARDERLLLGRLAQLHARFAGSPALAHPGLGTAARQLDLLSATVAEEEVRRHPEHPVFSRADRGWRVARERLAPRALALLEAAPREFERWADGLPRTLLHGDAKVANFARFPDGAVAAFDWSIPLAGPAPLELGYYLAMNARRLSRGRGAATRTYRAALERALGARLTPALARRLGDLALVAGASLVLWSKALALASGDPFATAEWRYYSKGLERLAAELV
jgi:hypothetical protein